MKSSDLTPEQAAPVHKQLREMLGYLCRLQARMQARGFPADDPLLIQTCTSWRSLMALTKHWQYIAANRPPWMPQPEDAEMRKNELALGDD